TSGVIFESILNRAPASAVRLNPDIPAGLEQVINKALEKDREVRCQSAAELRADLKRLKRDKESGNVVALAEPASKRIRLTRPRIFGIATALALGLGTVLYFALQHQGV